jgi:hypothetical protein
MSRQERENHNCTIIVADALLDRQPCRKLCELELERADVTAL